MVSKLLPWTDFSKAHWLGVTMLPHAAQYLSALLGLFVVLAQSQPASGDLTSL